MISGRLRSHSLSGAVCGVAAPATAWMLSMLSMLSMGGCGLISLDALTGGTLASADAGMDGSSGDAGSTADVSPDTVVEGGGVQVGSTALTDGCSGFNPAYATGSTSTLVRTSGQTSCSLCCTEGADTSPYCTLDDGSNTLVPNPAPGLYRVEAWAMPGPTTTSATLKVEALLREYDSRGRYTQESTNNAYSLAPNTWTLLENTLVVEPGGSGINAYVAAVDYSAGDCIVVDGLSIYLVTDGGT